MIGDLDRWLGDVLLGRPVPTHVLVRIARLFPPEAIVGLMRLAAELRAGDAGLRLLAGLALREPQKADQDLIGDILAVSDKGSPEVRADIYLTLAPWADEAALARLTKLTMDLPGDLAGSTRRSIEILRASGAGGAVGEPERMLDAIEREARFAGDEIDLKLARRLVELPPAERDRILRAGLGRALEQVGAAEGEPTITCTVCGAVNEASGTFCGTCGSVLVTASSAPPPAPEPDSVIPGKGTPKPTPDSPSGPGAAPEQADPTHSGPTVTCSVCGTVNDANRRFCRTCANELMTASASPPPPAPPAPSGPGSILGGIIGSIRDRFTVKPTMSAPPDDEPPTADPTAAPGKPPAKQRVVSTGLATLDRPGEPLDKDLGLAVDRDYLFWLEIGEPVAGSIETNAVGIANEFAEARAPLTVILFDADGSEVVRPGMDRAELRMNGDGSASVVTQPSDQFEDAKDELFDRRLFFPLRRQDALGTVSFRCNIYFRGLLIQSRLVRCDVLPPGALGRNALRSTLDYVLTRTLTHDQLRETEPQTLSVMVNEGQAGTNGFYFASGDATWAKGATFDGGEIQDALVQARGALRMAAWGTFDEWAGQPYLYEGGPDRERLTKDLIRICSRGASLYATLVARLAGVDADGKLRNKELRALMRSPGVVQVALHAGPRFVLPAALLYDYQLDTGRSAEFKLCKQFVDDLDAGEPLRDAECFKGNCPNATGALTTVCPSGLWGYRHAIGLPVSLPGGDEDDALPEEPGAGGQPPGAIKVKDRVEFSVGVSTDPDFKLFKTHAERMQALQSNLGWTARDTRDKTIDLMLAGTAHVVYFYCHGGQVNRRPFILVGPKTGNPIFGDNLLNLEIEWDDPRPLVFINGCHTVAVEPELAHDLVSAFVTVARASGVIGTEITIFEPLAASFAEAFMRSFIAGTPVGDSIRLARLELLRQSNPLGLVYTAYALANLKLVH